MIALIELRGSRSEVDCGGRMAASMALPLIPSLLAACLVLLVGGLLAQTPFLTRYSIPAPIVGGIIFALVAALMKQASAFAVTFDVSARTPFLLIFFASIGLTADVS